MKKLCVTLFMLLTTQNIFAADLLQAYRQALVCDPIYQQAISQQLANDEYVPIARAQLFPQANILGGPSYTKQHVNGQSQLTSTAHGYSFTLAVTQTVFNMAQFAALSNAKAIRKAADATANAAYQQLILRVAKAYFTVLEDEDMLKVNRINKDVYANQFNRINEEYKSGMKTLTDTYTARAAFETASAQYIASQTKLENDKENLRAITGRYYSSIAKLSDKFPLVSPQPADMNNWVQTAKLQNWSIQAALYNAQAARETIKQQFAGHLPTVSLQGAYNVAYNTTTSQVISQNTSSTTDIPNDGIATSTNNPTIYQGPGIPVKSHSQDASVSLNLGIPLFQGGQVVAQTNQAKYNYQLASQKLEQTIRDVINQTRQSYRAIIAGIQQIRAEKQAVKSALSSYRGLEETFRVGSGTLIDVLNEQQRVYQAQTQYAVARYDYVYNLLLLKYAAGTLNVNDLQSINAWLIESNNPVKHNAILEDKRFSYKSMPPFHRSETTPVLVKKLLAKNKIFGKHLLHPRKVSHSIDLALNKQIGHPDFNLGP